MNGGPIENIGYIDARYRIVKIGTKNLVAIGGKYGRNYAGTSLAAQCKVSGEKSTAQRHILKGGPFCECMKIVSSLFFFVLSKYGIAIKNQHK